MVRCRIAAKLRGFPRCELVWLSPRLGSSERTTAHWNQGGEGSGACHGLLRIPEGRHRGGKSSLIPEPCSWHMLGVVHRTGWKRYVNSCVCQGVIKENRVRYG